MSCLFFKASTTENRNKLGILKSNYVEKIEEEHKFKYRFLIQLLWFSD